MTELSVSTLTISAKAASGVVSIKCLLATALRADPIDDLALRRDTNFNLQPPPATGSALQRDNLTIGKGEAFGLQSDDVDEQR